MKKWLSLALSTLMMASMAVPAFAGTADLCGEELVKAAQAEIGNDTLVVYSPSSRMSKAGTLFTEKYGIAVESISVKDTEMIDKVMLEAQGNVDAADVTFIQDGCRLWSELLTTDLVKSYTPEALKDTVREDFLDPMVWDIPIKVFIYNNEKSDVQPFDNVWALTDPEWKGRFQCKDPFNEGVGMNFFTMVTRDDWAEKLAEAYKDYYGKEIELTTENAGYEWIKRLYENGMVLGSSDTTMNQAIGTKGQEQQLVGLYTINKTRTAKEKDLAVAPFYHVKPFTGFYYPIYALIPANSRYPSAAKLFIEFMLTPEGYQFWSSQIGDYSPNPDIENAEDSVSMGEWVDMLVREDPEWCADNRYLVEEFINSIM